MKYDSYTLPEGKDISNISFEDIRWQNGVFRYNSTGTGRKKTYHHWLGVKTNLGEIEEREWCKLAEAVIEQAGEEELLKNLIEWFSEHNYTEDSAAEIRKEALHLHSRRIFDNPKWVDFLPFNKRYRPEVWKTANIVWVRMDCCPEPGTVTQEQINSKYDDRISCPHCGRWSTFSILKESDIENL